MHPESVHLNRGNHESEGMNAVFGFLDEVLFEGTDGSVNQMVFWPVNGMVFS